MMHGDNWATDMTADHDRKNLDAIARARASGKIDDAAAEYLTRLYSNGMVWFRQVFYILGKCFGAPKAAVMQYDYDRDCAISEPMKITDINPLSPYLVQHRLDADPMRNQFFTTGAGHKIDLSVSSIVTVIVAAQKSVTRAIDKVSGKYYERYVNAVAAAANDVLVAHGRAAAGRAITDKIREKFGERFITNASETVLGIIGRGHEKIAVDLVRALDCVVPPHLRLQDVWRVKCLFDLVPQARTFIERMYEMMPDKIISIKDTFYDMENPRNYRDAKLVINIGTDDAVVPMEIICQVRTFFEYERKTHTQYEVARRTRTTRSDNIQRRMADFMAGGVAEYNLLICQCLDDLFDRVGWNILYSHGRGGSMFDGFPKECKLYYPQKVLEIMVDKLDNAVENEVFHLANAPIKLTPAQEMEIFRYMARFILVAAMPYPNRNWTAPSDTMAGKLFNFVMKEVQRYYKK